MNKKPKRQTKKIVMIGARIDPEMRDLMQEWADRNRVPLSWVINRVFEAGWPLFKKRDSV